MEEPTKDHDISAGSCHGVDDGAIHHGHLKLIRKVVDGTGQSRQYRVDRVDQFRVVADRFPGCDFLLNKLAQLNFPRKRNGGGDWLSQRGNTPGENAIHDGDAGERGQHRPIHTSVSCAGMMEMTGVRSAMLMNRQQNFGAGDDQGFADSCPPLESYFFSGIAPLGLSKFMVVPCRGCVVSKVKGQAGTCHGNGYKLGNYRLPVIIGPFPFRGVCHDQMGLA